MNYLMQHTFIFLTELEKIEKIFNKINEEISYNNFNYVYHDISKIDELWENFKNDVKKTQTNEITIKVPFDVNSQTIKTKFENNTFTVEVKNQNTLNEYSTYSFKHETFIPNEFINGEITQHYLEKNKEMIFTIHQNEKIGNVDELIKSINENNKDFTDNVVKQNNKKCCHVECECKKQNNKKNLHGEIWKLFCEGKSVDTIAKTTNATKEDIWLFIKHKLSKCQNY